jgi:hypothetical protein
VSIVIKNGKNGPAIMLHWCVFAGLRGVASMLHHLAKRFAALPNKKTMSNNIVTFSFD